MRFISTPRRSLRTIVALAAMTSLAAAGPAVVLAEPGLDPANVEATIAPGESLEIEKTVHTPAIPPIVDVCLLEDLTGSFLDDIGAAVQEVRTAAAVVSAQAALNRTIVDQLGGKTAEVAASATEHASASQEVTAAAEEQSASTEEMAAAAGDLLQGATRLTDAMSAFRT